MHSTLTEGLSSTPGRGRTSPFLYRVFDADRPSAPSGRYTLENIDEVTLGRADERVSQRTEIGGSRMLQIGVQDRWMSGQHARLSQVMRRWVVEDTKSKNGVRRNGVLVQRAELVDGDVLEMGRTFFVFRAADVPDSDLESDALKGLALKTLSSRLAVQMTQLTKIAPSVVSVALGGPSGSGKEVVARAIHAASRRGGPFIAVNCGALPRDLVESSLFGHKKGAFSGATEDRVGLIRASDRGTLFLDEVGDLPLVAQPALLRALQERSVVPVGATNAIPVDLRVISATHQDLELRVATNHFRDDLRARLTGFQLNLPALAARREDLGLLIAAFLERFAPQRVFQVQFSVAAARALFAYGWPLNVRELEKCVETALVLADESTIDLEHLPPALRQETVERPVPTADDEELDTQRRIELETLLETHKGNVSAVAREMGKARMQIQRWMNRYKLDPSDFR